MMDPVTIIIRRSDDIAAAERETIANLVANRRVVVLLNIAGARSLGLHAIPSGDQIMTTRGDDGVRAQHSDPALAVQRAFADIRDQFRGFKPRGSRMSRGAQ